MAVEAFVSGARGHREPSDNTMIGSLVEGEVNNVVFIWLNQSAKALSRTEV